MTLCSFLSCSPLVWLIWLVGMRKVVVMWQPHAHQEIWGDLGSFSMVFHLSESMGMVNVRNIFQGRWKWALAMAFRQTWTLSDSKGFFLSLSILFPRIWYIQFGCSGDSCLKQNWIQFPWHFVRMQNLALMWFVSAINKWQHYLGILGVLYFQEMWSS